MLRNLIREIVDICTYELSANCDNETHTDYVMYRLNGGTIDGEEDWYLSDVEEENND